MAGAPMAGPAGQERARGGRAMCAARRGRGGQARACTTKFPGQAAAYSRDYAGDDGRRGSGGPGRRQFRPRLIEQTARAMVTSGMKAAGYQYVNIDDCWLAAQRAADGQLQPNPATFPQGITAVADYVHSLGLKLGIYEDAGTAT